MYFSLDGSDGGGGGRPSASYTVSGFHHPGTAANKRSIASTLMCGKNAAGEPLPWYTMFSSDLPCIYTQLRHDSLVIFNAVTVNSKGGTER
jgi:hypothetical protein